MRPILLALLQAGLLAAQAPLFEQGGLAPGSGGLPDEWRPWTPNRGSAARLFVDPVRGRREGPALAVSGDSNPAACGGWRRLVEGIQPERWYRLTASYVAEGLDYEPRQVVVRLDWRDDRGARTGQPDYAASASRDGRWTTLRVEAPAPPKARAVELQLLLWDAPRATVWWDTVTLAPAPAPPPRPVRIAAIHLTPRNTGSAEASVGRFLSVIEQAVPEGTDLILLPEGITVVGTGLAYADVAETVPGPATGRLAECARRRGCWIAAGVYERENGVIYNTAVLLDRGGNLAGKYRKVYLPREETEGGITPGSGYPVFRTDFGRVGMMICWDVQYADPARALALRGADLILMPIWGGNRILAQARAIENQVFLVSSGYNFPTQILDPRGKVLAAAGADGTAAVATIDLNARYTDPWLGHMRDRFRKELRLDVPVEPPGHSR